MLSKLRSTIGRKLLSMILGPVLSALLVALNTLLPTQVQFSPADMKEIVAWILATVAAFIGTQGTVDVVEKLKTAAQPQPPTPVASQPEVPYLQ